jgi:protoporphyrinogen/coproporphyrinogen III oxidase
MTDVVVIGGGIAGLTAAFRLVRDEPSLDVLVLESAAGAGGRLRHEPVGDLELEAGPDSFVARKPWAAELCRELELELVPPAASGAFVWTERGLVPMPPTALGVPAEIGALARWPGLSRRGRARALADLVRTSRRAGGDEALGALLRRRLGDEATEALVAPMLAGLFAGDVDRLGVRATFPELERWERDAGSLIRGAGRSLGAAAEAGPMFLRPSEGMASLPAALVDALGRGRMRTSAPATALTRGGPGFLVGAREGTVAAAAVVLATPSFVTAELLADLAPAASSPAAAIPYVSTGVVHLVYEEETADALPEATGFVAPTGRAPMTAATFVSRKWPDPMFGSRAVLRCFVGAAGSEDVLDADDEDIVVAVCRHLAALLALPDRPSAWSVVRWPRSMPQYEVGHLERVAELEAALPPGIFVTGNAYGGVGVADTVRVAADVAGRVREHVTGGRSAAERTERVR